MFRRIFDQGQAGDNVGILLRGIERDDIEAQSKFQPNQEQLLLIQSLDAEVYVLTKEGGHFYYTIL